MMACVYAAAFGAIQQMPRIVPGLAEVRALDRTAQEQTISGVQSFQEFGGLAGRILLAGPGGGDRQPPPAAARVPDPRPVHAAGVFFLVPTVGLALAQWGIFAVGPGHHRAVQLLGQLPAARLSDAPARHRRELRRQRRRPDDRHVRRAGHDVARRRRCPAASVPIRLAYAAGDRRHDGLRHRRRSPASGCRSRKAKRCLTNGLSVEVGRTVDGRWVGRSSSRGHGLCGRCLGRRGVARGA